MWRCYRDTKMEIQGLSVAQNIHYQHGAPRGTASSPLRTTTAAVSRSVSNENEADGLSEAQELQSDDNNNRPRTSPFRLLAENGSGVCLPVYYKQNDKNNQLQQSQTNVTSAGLRNVNTLKELNAQLPAHDFLRTCYKYDVETGDSILQMALPFFEGEEEHLQQPPPQPPVLRQREDGASPHQSLAGESSAAPGTSKNTEEFYVVFNIVQEDGSSGDVNKDRPGVPPVDGDQIHGKTQTAAEGSKSSSESEGTGVLIEPGEHFNSFAVGKPLFNLLNSSSVAEGDEATVSNTKQPVYYETDGNVVLTNDYGDNGRGQACTENICGEMAGEPPSQSAAKDSSALISESADTVEAVEMSDAMETQFIPDPAGLSESNAETASASGPANETFSGTIMINNQSIIVTIENGILTLAAPPEGYVHKDDGMVSLKEHLGMKDYEDIVLLNYDGGTKSIGKISNVAVTGAGSHEEPRVGLAMSDSELALADDCSLSELGPSMESCTVIKQEGATTLCAITEVDLLSQCTKDATAECDNEDFQALNLLGLSKKGALVTFRCPQPGCASAFDTRQKLKIHLLNHAEDQRPFRCTFQDCGWAFTTSYKLKRHLQSHDKVRPHKCELEGCGRRFTTVYNLKAHVKAHDQEKAFVCEICNESFRSATRLTNHQRVHFEPQRPYKCEFPGCEKTFITFSALFSHNRTHFRETGQFTCTYPGCDKCYDKACRLKVHMRSHTGERPFVCDSESCGWTFTSMSKLLRHKRKHDDDRRFSCPEEGCGKSFTRAEHLKGHSITHLGTKPFQCHVEGCNAKFSARSSLYIHSKKHKQDAGSLRSLCPVASCSKHFSSRSSMKSHMTKHHHLSPDVLSQLEATPTLTPSSELISHTPTAVGVGPGVAGGDHQLANLDLSSLFAGGPASAPVGMATPSGHHFTMDLSLVSSAILTVDPSSVGAALGPAPGKAADALALAAAGADMAAHHGLEGGAAGGGGGVLLPPQGALSLDDVQTVTPEALGSLTALTLQGAAAAAAADHALTHTLRSSSALTADHAPSMAPPAPKLLASPPKAAAAEVGVGGGGGHGGGGAGPLLSCVEALGQPEGGFVFPGHSSSSFSPQKDPELGAASPSALLESGGSARTDYRAIQLAKRRKQRGPAACSGNHGGPGLGQRKAKGGKAGSASTSLAASGARYGDGASAASGGLTLRDPVTGAQYVQIQLLQDDPASDGDLPFQLSSPAPSAHSHSQLTVDLPANILQEPSAMTEDDNGSDNSQFTGSTINLQDLE